MVGKVILSWLNNMKKSLDEETQRHLRHQLIRLGDMMGDGCHLEKDGKWIGKEYKKILKLLGIAAPRKTVETGIVDEKMKVRT